MLLKKAIRKNIFPSNYGECRVKKGQERRMRTYEAEEKEMKARDGMEIRTREEEREEEQESGECCPHFFPHPLIRWVS